MIVLDASVLIAHLDAADEHHQRAGSRLDSAAAESLGASPITLAEVLVGAAGNGNLASATAALNDLGIASVQLTEEAPQRLALLRVSTGLKLPDCVLLAAEQAQRSVATFDLRLAAASDRGIRIRDN